MRPKTQQGTKVKGRVDFWPGRPRRVSLATIPKNNRSSTRRMRAVVFILLGVGFLFFLGRGMDLLLEKFWLTRVVHEGVIQVTAQAKAVAVRSEKTYTSRVKGTLTRLVPEGNRVRPGTVVAVIEDQERRKLLEKRLKQIQERLATINQPPLWQNLLGVTKPTTSYRRQEVAELIRQQEEVVRLLHDCQYPLYTNEAGMISYVTDGLEETLIPQVVTLAQIPPDFLAQLARFKAHPRQNKDGAEVFPGQPVYKVVDNHRLWLVTEVPDPPVTLLPGQRVRVGLYPPRAGREEWYPAVVVGASQERRKQVMVLEVSEYRPWFNGLRWLRVTVLYGRYEGVILPRRALIKKGERWGVYLREEGLSRFVPVTVVGGDHHRVAVTGIPDGARVLVRPEKGRREP